MKRTRMTKKLSTTIATERLSQCQGRVGEVPAGGGVSMIWKTLTGKKLKYLTSSV